MRRRAKETSVCGVNLKTVYKAGGGVTGRLPALNDRGKASPLFWNFLAINLKISELEETWGC